MKPVPPSTRMSSVFDGRCATSPSAAARDSGSIAAARAPPAVVFRNSRLLVMSNRFARFPHPSTDATNRLRLPARDRARDDLARDASSTPGSRQRTADPDLSPVRRSAQSGGRAAALARPANEDGLAVTDAQIR